MIRIDEIYNHTLWPWMQDNVPLTRLFFCDPPGRSDAESLFNFGNDVTELHYIFLHDQEPIHLDIHRSLFDAVVHRNHDLNNGQGPGRSAIITSEQDSEFVDTVSSLYGWQAFYYFFHGWASLDWYRGYDKTFLMPEPGERNITHSFISPNRIIGGRRDHRVLLMYHLLAHDLSSALISFPCCCPVEAVGPAEHAQRYQHLYPDIVTRLDGAGFPWHFEGEDDHPMHSCWLSLFDQNARSMCHVVTETAYFGRRHHLTEKTFKPICLRMPFVMAGTAGSLRYLRSYGFQTFGDFWDESYDDETDDFRRLERISDLLASFTRLTDQERQDLFASTIPVLEHNYQHFYQGGFESVLWQEFRQMLSDIRRSWN